MQQLQQFESLQELFDFVEKEARKRFEAWVKGGGRDETTIPKK